MISMASDYIQPFSAGLTHSTLTNMSSSSLNFASGTNSYFTSTNQSDVYIASFDSWPTRSYTGTGRMIGYYNVFYYPGASNDGLIYGLFRLYEGSIVQNNGSVTVYNGLYISYTQSGVEAYHSVSVLNSNSDLTYLNTPDTSHFRFFEVTFDFNSDVPIVGGQDYHFHLLSSLIMYSFSKKFHS